MSDDYPKTYVYGRKPACPACRSRSSVHTGRSDAGYQRRRCAVCGHTWRIPSPGWLIELPDGTLAYQPRDGSAPLVLLKGV